MIFFILVTFFLIISWFNKAPFIANPLANYYFKRVQFPQTESEHKDAVQLLTKVINLHPADPILLRMSYYSRSVSYFELKKYDLAFTDVSKGLELFPDYSPAHRLKANIYLALHQYQESLAEYTQAIQLDENEPEFYYDRSKLYYLHLKDLTKALQDINKALQINPFYPPHHDLAAEIYLALENFEKSLYHRNQLLYLVQKFHPSQQTHYQSIIEKSKTQILELNKSYPNLQNSSFATTPKIPQPINPVDLTYSNIITALNQAIPEVTEIPECVEIIGYADSLAHLPYLYFPAFNQLLTLLLTGKIDDPELLTRSFYFMEEMALFGDSGVVNLLQVEPLEIVFGLDYDSYQRAVSLMLPETKKLYLLNIPSFREPQPIKK